MEKQLTFEQAIGELEQIMKKLESGEISLEESLSLFEQGVNLSKTCQTMLDDAERKVSVLMTGPDGEKQPMDFGNEE